VIEVAIVIIMRVMLEVRKGCIKIIVKSIRKRGIE
jgi:hypothetical protein